MHKNITEEENIASSEAVEELRSSGRIIFECISGSQAYGTSTPNSDRDLRGYYINPKEEYLGLTNPSKQIGDEKHDITFYSLRRAFDLLQTANPNQIELLWIPDDCVIQKTEVMDRLIANRDLFISIKCFYTHISYARAQIGKARGQNKKVHNPCPEEQPKKEDFCWVIDMDDPINYTDMQRFLVNPNRLTDMSRFPCRPVSLKDSELDLSFYHASSVEHINHMYRLYYYGEESKGVFRGDDMLVCESIPMMHEHSRFRGFLIYNKDSYDKALKDHKSYWDWFRNRNSARWIDQENGTLNYDAKNIHHCVRLLMSGENILRHGFPIVRFEGGQLDYLMAIRSSQLEYDDIMKDVDARMVRLEELKETSAIPHNVNVKKLDALYRELTA